MKLRFSIRYRTEWGQQLIVCIGYRSTDGNERSTRLPMTTLDGDCWMAETSVVESRQHPMDSFCYHYVVADADGNVLRREWTMVPRIYHFDTSKTYVLLDQWRDAPLPLHLYSSAYATTTHQTLSTELAPLRLPLFRKTVLFRVSAPQLDAGQSLGIVGSHPALGSWSPARYMLMEYAGQKEWMLTLNVDGLQLPLEYKYVVVDNRTHSLLSWEDGDNRTVDEGVADGEVRVLYGDPLRLCEKPWRVAGVCVPVFSLRSKHSFGVGDFGDLYRLVDWLAATGMKVLQLLPLNDTTCSHTWSDSCPYNIVSAFALHPHYMDLEQLGMPGDQQETKVFRRQQSELNALDFSDYEAVERVKLDYIRRAFLQRGEQDLASEAFQLWLSDNAFWLKDYARWRIAHDKSLTDVNSPTDDGILSEQLIFFTQYHLHVQLKRAADHARKKGIFLKGDLPVGVNRVSAETSLHPEIFNMDFTMGTPPDTVSIHGQNWGFPACHWEQQDGDEANPTTWFRRRMSHAEQYFDAMRIDHVQGFFRTWEIPSHAVFASLGHFSPALPMTADEIAWFGLPFRKDLFTRPFINDRIVNRIFGIHAQYVREHFLVARSYGLYDLLPEVATQQQIRTLFDGKSDENSIWIRDGLYRLAANVLFIEDPRQTAMYHPRVLAYALPAFDALNQEEREAFMRLYHHYFFQRHSMLWGKTGLDRLQAILGDTRMLVCAEDLGLLPDCVEPVLDSLRVLTLELQLLPKESGVEFAHLDGNPVRSVATVSTHDMPPLRLWWEESAERSQRYYSSMLQKQGRAPEHLPALLAEEIIARHLYSPSMLCILSIQDLLAMNTEVRLQKPREERINVPADCYNRWQYRMPVTIEELLSSTHFNEKLKTMLSRSRR